MALVRVCALMTAWHTAGPAVSLTCKGTHHAEASADLHLLQASASHSCSIFEVSQTQCSCLSCEPHLLQHKCCDWHMTHLLLAHSTARTAFLVPQAAACACLTSLVVHPDAALWNVAQRTP